MESIVFIFLVYRETYLNCGLSKNSFFFAVKSSNMVTPSEYKSQLKMTWRSDRAGWSDDLFLKIAILSGAAYIRDIPFIWATWNCPTFRICGVMTWDIPRSDKTQNVEPLCISNKTLSGFKSLWTTPFRCIACSPDAISLEKDMTCILHLLVAVFMNCDKLPIS